MAEQHPFKWRHFQAEIILLCVRWYVRYALSYRDGIVNLFVGT
jgi:IS6 family transposase